VQYTVTACQIALSSCYGTDGVYQPAVLERNLAHIDEFVRAQHTRAPSRLYLLPEFSLQGWSLGVPLEQWNASAVSIPGPETERLGSLAREVGAYVAGTAFEVVPEYPGRHFLTGYLIAPDGSVVLRYRKTYAVSAKTRPGDVYRSYVERFGRESLFPVVATPLGRIGMVIAWDAIFPETTRALAMRGAEVILHPLGSARIPAEAGTGYECYRRARAFENVAYFVSANFGPLDSTRDSAGARWPSEVVDFEGRVIAAADTDGECGVSATVDLAALRAHRAKPIRNWLAHLQPQLHAPDYAAAKLWPLSRWDERPMQSAKELLEVEAEVWRTMRDSGAL